MKRGLQKKKKKVKAKGTSTQSSAGELLIGAAVKGNIDEVKKILETRSSEVGIHYQDRKGQDALMHASKGGDAKTVAALLELGADPTHTDKNGSHALLMAASAGCLAVAKVLLEATSRHTEFKNIINIPDSEGLTPLCKAVDKADRAMVHELLGNEHLDLMMGLPCDNGDPQKIESIVLYSIYALETRAASAKLGPGSEEVKIRSQIVTMILDEVRKRKELRQLLSELHGDDTGENSLTAQIAHLFCDVPVSALLQEVSEATEEELPPLLLKEVNRRFLLAKHPPQLTPRDIDTLLDLLLDAGELTRFGSLKRVCSILEALICPLQSCEPQEPPAPAGKAKGRKGQKKTAKKPKATASAGRTHISRPDRPRGRRERPAKAKTAGPAAAKLNFIVPPPFPRASQSPPQFTAPSEALCEVYSIWRVVHIACIHLMVISQEHPEGMPPDQVKERRRITGELEEKYQRLSDEINDEVHLGERLLLAAKGIEWPCEGLAVPTATQAPPKQPKVAKQALAASTSSVSSSTSLKDSGHKATRGRKPNLTISTSTRHVGRTPSTSSASTHSSSPSPSPPQAVFEQLWAAKKERLLALHAEIEAFLKTVKESEFTRLEMSKTRILESVKIPPHTPLTPQLTPEYCCEILFHILELLERDGMCMMFQLRNIDDTLLPERFFLLTCFAAWLMMQIGWKEVGDNPFVQKRLKSLDLIWTHFRTASGFFSEANLQNAQEEYDRFGVLLYCMLFWMQISQLVRGVSSDCKPGEHPTNRHPTEVIEFLRKGGSSCPIPIRMMETKRQSSSTLGARRGSITPTGRDEGAPVPHQQHIPTPLTELMLGYEAVESALSQLAACQSQRPPALQNPARPYIMGWDSKDLHSCVAWVRGRTKGDDSYRFKLKNVNLDVLSLPADADGSGEPSPESKGLGVKLRFLTGWNCLRGSHRVLDLRSRNTEIWNASNPKPPTEYEEHSMASALQTISGCLQLLLSIPIHPEFLEFCMSRYTEINFAVLKGRVDTSHQVLRGLEVFVKHPQLVPLMSSSIRKDWLRAKVRRVAPAEKGNARGSPKGTPKHPPNTKAPVVYYEPDGTFESHDSAKYSEDPDDCDDEPSPVQIKKMVRKGNVLPLCTPVPFSLETWGIEVSDFYGFRRLEDEACSTDSEDSMSLDSWDEESDEMLGFRRRNRGRNVESERNYLYTPRHQDRPKQENRFRRGKQEWFDRREARQGSRTYPLPPEFMVEGTESSSISLWQVVASRAPVYSPDDKGEHDRGSPDTPVTYYNRNCFVIGEEKEGRLHIPFGYWIPVRPTGSPVLKEISVSTCLDWDKGDSEVSFVESDGDFIFFCKPDEPISFVTGVNSWEELTAGLCEFYGCDRVVLRMRDDPCPYRSSPRSSTPSRFMMNPYGPVPDNASWPPMTSLSCPLQVREYGEVEPEELGTFDDDGYAQDELDKTPMEEEEEEEAEEDEEDEEEENYDYEAKWRSPLHDDAVELDLLDADDDLMGNQFVLRVNRTEFYESIKPYILEKSVHQGIEVKFRKEPGSGDGPNKEFFGLVAKEIFLSPQHKLFVSAMEGCNKSALLFNPKTTQNEDLDKFAVAGRLLGFALTYGYEVGGVELARGYYKILLSHPLTIGDLRWIDLSVYNSLTWILNNNIDDADLGLYFVHSTANENGEVSEIELIPNGRTTLVTNTNKEQFIKLKLSVIHTLGVEPALQAFCCGFWTECPSSIGRYILTADDLVAAFAGTTEINPADWEMYTSYENPKAATSDVVRWFWQYVRELDEEGRRKLLSFATGSSTLPVGGFAGLAEYAGESGTIGKAFTIEIQTQREETLQQMLPSAHTCFNTLILPKYNSFERLKERLNVAIDMGHYGYHEV